MNMTSTPTRRKSLNIGALWLSETRAGDDYFSGHITLEDGRVLDIAVFKNRYKTPDNKKPEYIVYTPDLSDVTTDELTDEPHPF